MTPMQEALESTKWWIENATEDHKSSEMFKFATALLELQAENARWREALVIAREKLEQYSSHSSLDGNEWGFWEPKTGWEQDGKQVYYYEGTRPWIEAREGVVAIDAAIAAAKGGA